MPRKVEEALRKEAKEKGLGEKRSGAYIYGTLRKLGWKPKSERTKDSQED